jgi:hypothetical protein
MRSLQEDHEAMDRLGHSIIQSQKNALKGPNPAAEIRTI